MASEVDICNRALGKLGAATIISLEDDDPKAVVLKVAYPIVRDAELRRRRWRFSLKRASLAADAATPDFDFDLQYPMPADCLRVIRVGQYHIGLDLSDYRGSSNSAFSIEGRFILTNMAAPLPVRYISRIEDTGLFDAAFVETFAARLSYECCERITQSDSKKAACLADYKMSVREAARANALEVAPESQADDTWIMARIS